MKKFVFELQNLQDMKKREEDLEKVRLGESEARLRKLNYKLESLESECISTSNELIKEVGRATNSNKLCQYNDYLKKLEKTINIQKKLIEEENQKKSVILEKLVQLQKELKSLEKLKEKKIEEYKKEEKKEEEKIIDDIVSFKVAAS